MNREFAYAYKLGKITHFENPKKSSDFDCVSIPRSFIYNKLSITYYAGIK